MHPEHNQQYLAPKKTSGERATGKGGSFSYLSVRVVQLFIFFSSMHLKNLKKKVEWSGHSYAMILTRQTGAMELEILISAHSTVPYLHCLLPDAVNTYTWLKFRGEHKESTRT